MTFRRVNLWIIVIAAPEVRAMAVRRHFSLRSFPLLRIGSLQLMAPHKAFVAKAIGQGAPSADPAHQGVKSAFSLAVLFGARMSTALTL